MNPATPSLRLAAFSLWKREMVRFFRQKNRVIGALAQPVIFWLLFGFGLTGSMQPQPGQSEADYVAYFFPGVVLMILLFTAIFSTISIIEDRKEGFLQAVLVAPVSRSAIVLGKVLGGASVAVAQGVMFLALAPLVDVSITWMGALIAFGWMIVIACSLTALGVCIAWRMESSQGFHAIMTVFLFPMWILSGAMFPVDKVPAAMAWVMKANPMTYALYLIRAAVDPAGVSDAVPAYGISASVVVLFTVLIFGAAWVLITRKPE